MQTAENPQVALSSTPHRKKKKNSRVVWDFMTQDRQPIFFDTTMTCAVYTDIVQQFVAFLNGDERYCWFQ